jgi:hypothetical protein
VTTPDFDELVGDVEPGERERLLRTHELLIAAGPPPELSPVLAQPPGSLEGGDLVPALPRSYYPRRRVVAAGLLAAALALAAFAAGFRVGDRDEDFESVRTISMHGTAWEPSARASLQLGKEDASGNLPMLLKVQGLPELKSPRGYYTLMLTRDGEPLASCGTFRVHGGTTEVPLSAAYEFTRFDGWVVVVHERGHVEDPPVVMTAGPV